MSSIIFVKVFIFGCSFYGGFQLKEFWWEMVSPNCMVDDTVDASEIWRSPFERKVVYSIIYMFFYI